MFHVWQMNNGRWQVDAFTSAPRSAHTMAMRAPSFDTWSDAEAYRRGMVEAWAEARDTVRPYSTELTPAGEQTVIPGCERNLSPKAKQLELF